MPQTRYLWILLILLALVAAACTPARPTAPPAADIEAAVQATLTAVAAATETTATPAPDDTPAPAAVAITTEVSTPAAASSLVLPPQIPNFNPTLREEKGRGDRAAPVVMYEWSDYT